MIAIFFDIEKAYDTTWKYDIIKDLKNMELKDQLPIAEQHKFLGIIFDKKLTFKPHIKYLRSMCNKTIHLLRVIAHTDRGADENTQLKLYQILIRSKHDYGTFIYVVARKSYLKQLNTIHHLTKPLLYKA